MDRSIKTVRQIERVYDPYHMMLESLLWEKAVITTMFLRKK